MIPEEYRVGVSAGFIVVFMSILIWLFVDDGPPFVPPFINGDIVCHKLNNEEMQFLRMDGRSKKIASFRRLDLSYYRGYINEFEEC